MGIMEILLSKIRKENINDKNIKLAKEFLSTCNKDTFQIFKYLQSIYSTYRDEQNNIFFPIFYTVLFHKDFFKSSLKADLIMIAENQEELKLFDDSIDYSKINKEFLQIFNKLLTSKANEKNILYLHLSDFSHQKNNKNVDSIVENFNYQNIYNI